MKSAKHVAWESSCFFFLYISKLETQNCSNLMVMQALTLQSSLLDSTLLVEYSHNFAFPVLYECEDNWLIYAKCQHPKTLISFPFAHSHLNCTRNNSVCSGLEKNTSDDSWLLKCIIHASVNPYSLENTGTWLCGIEGKNYWGREASGISFPWSQPAPPAHTHIHTYNPCFSQQSCVLFAFYFILVCFYS